MLSISTIIGVALGVALFVFAIVSSTDNYLMFYSISSFSLVLGGTLAASLISYSVKDVIKAMLGVVATFWMANNHHSKLRGWVGRFVEWSRLMRDKGLSAMEDSLNKKEKKDDFVAYAVDLLGSGYGPQDLRQMLTDAMDSAYQRAFVQTKILNTMATYSPGFGMVGTIIGLIIMLDNMDGDIVALGKGLALALITTLYGILLAQFIFKPAAVQVAEKTEARYFRHQLLAEGFILLAEKTDSLSIQDKLNAFLKPNSRFKFTEQGG